MTFGGYSNLVRETITHPFEDEVIYPSLGLSEATGKIAKEVRKMVDDEGLDILQLMENLGDVLYYANVLAEDLELSLADIAERNVESLGLSLKDIKENDDTQPL